MITGIMLMQEEVKLEIKKVSYQWRKCLLVLAFKRLLNFDLTLMLDVKNQVVISLRFGFLTSLLYLIII